MSGILQPDEPRDDGGRHPGGELRYVRIHTRPKQKRNLWDYVKVVGKHWRGTLSNLNSSDSKRPPEDESHGESRSRTLARTWGFMHFIPDQHDK